MSPHTPRVLVTGATGFIGKALVAELRKRGAELALWQHQSAPEGESDADVRIVTGDVRDGEAWAQACKNQDVIFHLAAFIPQNMNDANTARDCFEINALGALYAAQSVSASGAHLIHFSTGNLYAPSETPVNENAPTFPAARAPYYLASKLAGEIFVEHMRQTRALNAAILRVGSVYGWEAPRSVVSYWMQQAAQGSVLRVLDGGKPRYDFVHVSDIVQAACAVMQKNVTGIFNLGAGQTHSLLDLAQHIAAVFPDRTVETDIVPPTGNAAPNFSPLDCTRAHAAWGYAPRTLAQGLQTMRAEMEADARNRV